MEIGEIIKERIALFNELYNNTSIKQMDDPNMRLQIATILFQEVCKDDRQNRIYAERKGNLNYKSANTAWEGFDKAESQPATEKQVNLMIKLKIPSGKYTKAEASHLIEEALNPKKRSE